MLAQYDTVLPPPDMTAEAGGTSASALGLREGTEIIPLLSDFHRSQVNCDKLLHVGIWAITGEERFCDAQFLMESFVITTLGCFERNKRLHQTASSSYEHLTICGTSSHTWLSVRLLTLYHGRSLYREPVLSPSPSVTTSRENLGLTRRACTGSLIISLHVYHCDGLLSLDNMFAASFTSPGHSMLAT